MKPGRPLKTRPIPLDDIILLPKTMQPRVKEDADQVARYREDMSRGDTFPPVVLYKGTAGQLAGLGLTHDGTIAELEATHEVLVLADGYHRVAAARAADRAEILATVETGSWREAQWFALGANHTHGWPVTHADKRKIVGIVLTDKEWSRRSARAIAEHCHVSPAFVDKLKKERADARTTKGERSTAYVGSQDTVVVDKRGRTMQTAKIGTTPAKTKAAIGTLTAPAPVGAALQATIDRLIPPAPVTPANVTMKIAPAPEPSRPAVNVHQVLGRDPGGDSSPANTWDRAAIMLQGFSGHHSIQSGLRTTLQHARTWERDYPQHSIAFFEFFTAIARAFTSGEVTR